MTVQPRAEPPLQQILGAEPAYSALKDARVVFSLCVLAVLFIAAFFDWVIYLEDYASRERRRRFREESRQNRLEDGLAATAGSDEEGEEEEEEEAAATEMTSLLPDDAAPDNNYAAIKPRSQLESIYEEALHQHQHHHHHKNDDEKVDDDDDDDGEEYVYDVFAPRPPPLLLRMRMQGQLRFYVDRLGQCRTCVRDVLHRRFEGRQRAAAEVAGTVGMRLGGRRVHRDGLGEVCEICWVEA
ncbi:hypothetical protein PG993_003079 [Apiospora rasikravindrae]|uniref:Transmembrane protein n=1 Tax=Apiospora rasikravindrae TaxID=990691 RepID=A0ABR1U181_9PEZI